MKREVNESKKGVYDIYTLHLVLWEEKFSTIMEEEARDGCGGLVGTSADEQIVDQRASLESMRLCRNQEMARLALLVRFTLRYSACWVN